MKSKLLLMSNVNAPTPLVCNLHRSYPISIFCRDDTDARIITAIYRACIQAKHVPDCKITHYPVSLARADLSWEQVAKVLETNAILVLPSKDDAKYIGIIVNGERFFLELVADADGTELVAAIAFQKVVNSSMSGAHYNPSGIANLPSSL